MEFLLELNKLKDHIENLARTDPQTANFEVAKLWGPNELQRKFQEWFEANGFEMPMMN